MQPAASSLLTPFQPTEETSLLVPLPAPPSYTAALSVAVFCATLSSFQVGLNSGLLNVPEQVIRSSLQLSVNEWSIIVSIFCIGGLIGSLLGGRLADTIGRKNLLTSVNVLFISGALLQSCATSYWMLLLGRLVIGCGCGCATVSVPMYVGEIAPAALRGSLGTMNQFAIVIGILVANLLGRVLGGQPADSTSPATDGSAAAVGGVESQWRYLLGVVVFPSLLQLVLSSFLLESPLWLIQQNSHTSVADAESVLTKLRGADYEDLDFELELLSAVRDDSIAAQQSDSDSLLSSLNSRPVRRSLWIGLMLQLFQQFSGINAVFYYSTAFFASAHVGDPWLASVLCSGVNVVATGLAIPLMDRAGRRTLLILSALGMMISCIGLTAALELSSAASDSSSPSHSSTSHHHSSSSPPPTDSHSSYLLSSLSVIGVLAYVTCFEVGLGPIPWLMGAELYPASARALGMSLAAVVNWTSNFVISLSFPHMSARLRQWTFLPFSAALALCVLFVWLVVPETRGKTLEEIQEELGGVRRERGEGGGRGGMGGIGGGGGGGGGYDSEGGYESESSVGSWGVGGGVDVLVEYGDGSEASPSPVSLTPVSGTRSVWKGGVGGGHGRVSSHDDLRAASR